jgi:hypothetical protein
MSDAEPVTLWRTGCDIYVYGLKASSTIPDSHALQRELRKGHRMDAPIEVQGKRRFLFWWRGLNIASFSPGAEDIP